MRTGVDLSHWNGKVDFKKLKNSGVNFVIIKAGGNGGTKNTNYKDICFDSYYQDAVRSGLEVGCYYFVGKNFTTEKEGVERAKHFFNIIKGKKFSMPIYLDNEVTPVKQKTGATDAAIAFCDYLESIGYFVGIYGSDISVFKDRYELDRLKDYSLWVARYGKEPQYVKNYGMWQKSENGSLPGITGPVDINVSLIDYPTIIKSKHFNNW